MDDINKYATIIDNYRLLEQSLNDCLKYIPYYEENKNTYSSKFIPLILDSCGLIESIFADYLAGKGEHKYNNFLQYSNPINKKFNLNNSITIFLVSPIQFIIPFENWIEKPPSWWIKYNQLKHDRIDNYKVATLQTVVDCICALHQVISRNSKLLIFLFADGWFNKDSEDLIDVVGNQMVGEGYSYPLGLCLPAETILFISPTVEEIVEYNGKHYDVDDNVNFSHRARSIIGISELFLL
ncbi:MAG: hypothetical protein HQ528_10380 [Candidatus Marinimicrobia bacterium]|nr:hypothetical protein [Candidatus Neomarinimicrobiota bacterium]